MRALACVLLLAGPASAETITRTFTPPPGTVAGWAVSRGRTSAEELRRRAAETPPSGAGDRAVIVQRGDGDVATVSQTGGGNRLLLVQIGDGATAVISQTGGEQGVVVQWSHPDRLPVRPQP